MKVVSEYDVKSLQHERRMLDLYRSGIVSDGGLLEPLANACWRASTFEWRLHEDVGLIRRLWEEAAKALVEGFVRRRAGFDRRPDLLLLAAHFSIASRRFDLVKILMHISPATQAGSTPLTRAQSFLLRGYLSVARAILEGNNEYARAAQDLLEDARLMSDSQWLDQQLHSAREPVCKTDEHEAIRRLLSTLATLIAGPTSILRNKARSQFETVPEISGEFESLMDSALLNLDMFVQSEINHLPKFYYWLPGIALSILAEQAGLSSDWLQTRQQGKQTGYDRLPFALCFNNA
jgi:hypothetical protein